MALPGCRVARRPSHVPDRRSQAGQLSDRSTVRSAALGLWLRSRQHNVRSPGVTVLGVPATFSSPDAIDIPAAGRDSSRDNSESNARRAFLRVSALIPRWEGSIMRLLLACAVVFL